MTTAINKKIAFIPTELNAFTYLKYQYKKQDKLLKNLCTWMFVLLLWCTLLTGFLIFDNIEHTPPELQQIPVEYLEVE